MSVQLIIPGLRDMAARQAWLMDPATMAYNRGRDLGGAEGYHPDTGCIDFSRENWRWWRQVWLYNEPDFYAAYIRDEDTDAYVGEVCWFREEDAFTAGILIAADHRGKGFCAPALLALADRAFRHDEIPALRCAFPADNLPGKRGFLRTGFHVQAESGGMLEMVITREEWERM